MFYTAILILESFMTKNDFKNLHKVVLHAVFRRKMLGAGAIVLSGIVICAVFGPFLTRYDPNESNWERTFEAPSKEHWLGTDSFGRDVWTRIVYGARISLRIAVAVVGISGMVGTVVGLAGGFFPSLKAVTTCLISFLMTFPAIFLAIIIMTIMGGGELNVVIALSVVLIPRTARIVRATTLSVKEENYIEAERGLGASSKRILFRHVLPNCISPLIIQLTFCFAYAILTEAALSFIGVGPAPPTPSWGRILSEGRNYIRVAPWLTLYPGMAIALTVLGVNLTGDGLRDWLDPRFD